MKHDNEWTVYTQDGAISVLPRWEINNTGGEILGWVTASTRIDAIKAAYELAAVKLYLKS